MRLNTFHPPDEGAEAEEVDGLSVSMVAGAGIAPISTSASDMTLSNSGSFDITYFERGKKDHKNKNDNCRIRTCAGKAQQISSLSP